MSTKENLLVIGFALLVGVAIAAAMNWMVPFNELWGPQ